MNILNRIKVLRQTRQFRKLLQRIRKKPGEPDWNAPWTARPDVTQPKMWMTMIGINVVAGSVNLLISTDKLHTALCSALFFLTGLYIQRADDMKTGIKISMKTLVTAMHMERALKDGTATMTIEEVKRGDSDGQN